MFQDSVMARESQPTLQSANVTAIAAIVLLMLTIHDGTMAQIVVYQLGMPAARSKAALAAAE